MKTNADPSPHGLKNTCARERAFTLTDLLVVMATLAILAAVMLPALARSGDNGMRMVCLNNLRQLGMAQNMYTGENQDTMPWPNWGNDYSALSCGMVIWTKVLIPLTTFSPPLPRVGPPTGWPTLKPAFIGNTFKILMSLSARLSPQWWWERSNGLPVVLQLAIVCK